MHRSGDEDMHTLKIAASALACLIAALPAAAEGWGVSDKPSVTDLGQSMCLLWYGKTAPMMNITIMSDRNFISVVASQFEAVEDGAEARLAYPSGRGGTVKLRKADARADGVFVFFPDAVVDAILDQFRTPGTFTLTSGEVSASFPVPGLDSGIAPLKACVAQFPGTPEAE